LGGSLGAIVASQLQEWPQVLDALESTPMSSVSRVVETEFGFHIFFRAQTPEMGVVTGSRIVIGHDAAPWIRVAARGVIPARSRDAAWKRALEVYERAKADPDQFDALVNEFSDHRDAQRQGDIGSWSATEPTFIGREVSTLQKLALGEVAAPIETVFGVQVIKRVQNRPRKQYAMLAIRLPFETRGPAVVDSQSRARELSEKLLVQIRDTPETFFGLLRDSGGGLEQWQEGRASAALEEHLDRLQIDEISATPVLDDLGYVLARRVRPSPLLPSLTDLRARESIDLIELLSALPRLRAQSLLAACAQEHASSPQLRDELAALHREWSSRFQSAHSHPARLAAIAELQTLLRRRLGDSAYQTYLHVLRQRLHALEESTANDDAPTG
jgi:hypothetical protein